MGMDVVLSLAPAADSRNIQLVARRDESMSEYVPRDNIESGGGYRGLLHKSAPAEALSEIGLSHGD